MLEQFNILDWIIVGIGLIFVIKALRKGFLKELGSLLGLVIAAVASLIFFQPLANFLRKIVGSPDFYWEAISFIVCFLIILLVIIWIAGRLSKIIQQTKASWLDRFMGMFVGLVKAVIISYLLIATVLLYYNSGNILGKNIEKPNNLVTQSYLAPSIVQAGQYFMSLMPESLVNELQNKAGLLTDNLPSS